MLLVHFDGIVPRTPGICVLNHPEISVSDVSKLLEDKFKISSNDVYFTQNGKRLSREISLTGGVIHACLRLVGGKGGFGSMLRAIGAQIEKTTNREACRDLSGRRLRDINEEKRLKNWINMKAEREREVLERKRKKLEKLRSEPKHDFSDKKYEEERSKLTSEVCDAVEKGFKVAGGNPGSSSSMSSSKPKKGFMFEEEEITSASSEGDSDDEKISLSDMKRKAEAADLDASPSKRVCLSPTNNSNSSDSSDSNDSSDTSCCDTNVKNSSDSNDSSDADPPNINKSS